MSLHLLPVKTGIEQFPVRFRNVHQMTSHNTWYCSVSCEHDRILYFAIQDRNWYGSYGDVYVYKMNLFTSETSYIGMSSFGNVGNNYMGGILVDDNYIYISAIAYPTITIFTKNTFGYVGRVTYSDLSCTAYGHIEWMNDHTILMAVPNGYLTFDTKTYQFNYKNLGTEFTASDFAYGKTLMLETAYSSTTNNVRIIRIGDDTFETFALTSNTVPVCTYSDGKFYIANNQYLYVYDEETETIEKTVTLPWNSPNSITVTNNDVFVTTTESGKDRRLYMYNINHTDYRYIMMPWNFIAKSTSQKFRPIAFAGFWFGLNETLGIIDYSGDSKYNFGYKYDSFTLLFNESNRSEFEYDPRFIKFTETYATICDGDIRTELQPVEGFDHIKSASIHKADYKKFKSISLKYIEGSDTDDG